MLGTAAGPPDGDSPFWLTIYTNKANLGTAY